MPERVVPPDYPWIRCLRPGRLAVRSLHRPRRPGISTLPASVLRESLDWSRGRPRSLGRAVPEMARGSPPFAVVRKNVRSRGASGVVKCVLEALCETRVETSAAAPMGLAFQSLLMRDDRGGLRRPFQFGGAGSTSASDLSIIIAWCASSDSCRSSGDRSAAFRRTVCPTAPIPQPQTCKIQRKIQNL